MKTKPIRWFLEQLPILQRDDVISAETAESLDRYYQGQLAATPGGLQMGERIVMALAALLLAGGIILVFAHNWDALTRPMRAAVSIAPTVLGIALGAWVLFKRKGRGATEFVGIWLTVSVYASLGLVTQTYNLGGTLETFMAVIVISTLLLPWVFDSSGAWLLQLVGMVAWCCFLDHNSGFSISGMVLFPACFFLGPVLRYWQRLPLLGPAERAQQSVWFILAVLITACVWLEEAMGYYDAWEYPLIFLICGSFFHLAGMRFRRTGDRGCSAVYLSFGWLSIVVGSLLVASGEMKGGSNWFHVFMVPLAVLVACAAILIRRQRVFDAWVALFPMVLLGVAAVEPDLLPTLVIAGTAIAGICSSVQRGNRSLLNGAAVLLIGVSLMRFFVDDYPMLIRGLAFVVVGLLLLMVHRVLQRYKRTHQTKPLPAAAGLPRWSPPPTIVRTMVIVAFAVSAVVVLALPVGHIVSYQRVLREGTSYRIDCTIYDPYDPFAGRYVRVRPRIQFADGVDGSYHRDEWYTLTTGANGLLEVASVTNERPTDTSNYVSSDFKAGLYRFYLNETVAPAAEKAMNEIARQSRRSPDKEQQRSRVTLQIRVLDGKAISEQLYIDNIPITEYVTQRAERVRGDSE